VSARARLPADSDQSEAQAGRMEVVGRFAVGIAHDFNNLLAAMLAASEAIAQRPGVDAATREDAVQIGAAAPRNPSRAAAAGRA